MKDSDQRQLRHELGHVGASKAEIMALLPVAAKLEQLAGLPLPAIEPRPQFNFKVRLVRNVALTIAGIAAVFMLIAVSQSVSPMNVMYPLQKLSDNVAVAVHPQYRANVMMKRAQQVNTLVASHASSDKVLAVLADYDNEAKAYQTMPHANYAAFEFCKANLQQAAKVAPAYERHAILASLQSLNDI